MNPYTLARDINPGATIEFGGEQMTVRAVTTMTHPAADWVDIDIVLAGFLATIRIPGDLELIVA